MSSYEGGGGGRGRGGGGGRGRGDRGRGDGGGRGGRGDRGGFGGRGGGGYPDRGGFDRGQRGFGGGGGGGRGGGRGGGMDVQIFRQPGVDTRPDERVTRAEDAFQASAGGVLNLSRLSLQNHPSRPGYGTKGTPVLLLANYVQIVPRMDLELHKYSISCAPEVKGKKLGWVIQLALQSPELSTYKNDLVTDFRSTLVTQRKFESDDFTLNIQYRAEGEDVAEDAAIYKVRIQYTNSLPVSELMQYLTSSSQNPIAEVPEILQAFNIFLNHYAKLENNQVRVGSSKTFSLDDRSATRSLGSGLAAIRGFFSSVRLAICRILVNVNVSNAAFYEPGPLTDLMAKFSRAHADKFSLGKFVEKVAIRTTHLPRKVNRAGQEIHRPKRITGLATPNDGEGPNRPKVKAFGAGSNDVQFWLEDRSSSKPSAGGSSKPKSKGKKGQDRGKPEPSSSSSPGRYITVAEYFRTQYQMVLKQPQASVVNTGTRQNPIYLPPEVCIVLPGQNSRSKLDPEQTQEMIKFAVRKPWENANSIMNEGIQMVGLDPATNKMLEHFGINVHGHLITVPGRVLESPKVQYSGNRPLNTQFGSWNLRDVTFRRAGTMQAWSCVYISMGNMRNPFSPQAVAELMNTLHGNLRKVGITAPAPRAANPLTISGPDDPALDSLMSRAAANFTVLYVILPTKSTPLYERIKLLGDVKHGIHTICGIAPTISKQQGPRLDQYFANVALKFNLKLGGINHSLDTSRMPLLAEGKTLLLGIDVTHPAPGSSAPSIAAVVASVDRSAGQFPADLRIQESRRESVTDLEDMFVSRLKLWRKTSGSLPENIVVYRDGVSEGQYDKVLGEELPQLRSAAAKIYSPQSTKTGLPRITIIVVGKRHHTRFYPTAEAEADRGGNTRPGTVVDRGVTRAENWDFYLQPHAALQGTARPGHYYVILDEVFRAHYRNMKPGAAYRNVADVLEEFTHSLCYMFARATKAVSLCPPAYYADIACERARCYISGVYGTPAGSVAGGSAGTGPQVGQSDVKIHPKLEDSMFYI